MIGDAEHLLVLQTVARDQTGKYKCQVTMDAPPFQFIESAAHLTVMVLPERHPVITGLKKTTYLPGNKLSINCTSSPSYPSAKLSWFLNKKKVDRWMVTSFLPLTDQQGLESSTLGLNFSGVRKWNSGRRVKRRCRAYTVWNCLLKEHFFSVL